MPALIATLVILALAVWFYLSAQRVNLPALPWALGGVAVYYGGFLFWMHLVLRSVLGARFHTHGFWLGIGMDLTAILFGALCAALFRWKVLMAKNRRLPDSAA